MISKSLKLHSHNIFKSLKMKHIWWRYKWVLFGDGFSLPYSFSFALQRWFLRVWSCTHSHNIFESLKMKHIWWRYKWVLFGDVFNLLYSFSFALQRWSLRVWSCTPITLLNHSKWSTYDEDINECYLVMGSVYLLIFLCTSQRWFLRVWSCTPITFLNHSKWSTYDEDINECYLVMGSVYPTHFPLHFKDDF